MLATGTPAVYILALIGGNEPVVRLVERNPRFQVALETRIDWFWGHVTRREPPPVDGSDATSRLLSRLYSDPTDDAIVLPPEAAEWDAKLLAAKLAIISAEAIKTECENKIKAALGNATVGKIPGNGLFPGGGMFTWKEQVSKYPAREAYESRFRVLRRAK